MSIYGSFGGASAVRAAPGSQRHDRAAG